MQTRFTFAALSFLLVTAACRPPGTPVEAQQPALALTNATVIDGTGAPARAATTVVIRDGRIIAVQPAADALPAGTRVHDLTGKFVIPGLIDSHVHLGTQQRPEGVMAAVLRSVFMGGVTSVRDMGGRYDIVRPLAQLGAVDSLPTPRVVFAAIMSGGGMWIEGERGRFFAGAGAPGESPTVRRLASMDDVVPAVAAARAAGAAGIKIYNAIDPALVRAVAAEARRQGLRVWSHLWVDPGSPGGVIAAGAEVVSHADMFVAELLPDSVRRIMDDEYRAARHRLYLEPNVLESSALGALLGAMKERRTIVDATLFVMRPAPDSAGRIEERRAALFRSAVGFVRRVHGAGIDVAAGTDAIGGSTPNLHTELQLLVDSVGMAPMEAIRAATSVNARALGIADSVGTIEPGRIADLVILEADPTADIANTITVSGVMKAGHLHPRERPMPVPPGARGPRGRWAPPPAR